MKKSAVQEWIDAYISAWRSYDPAAIADLFSEDATYAYQPWATPVVGREAIAESWLASMDDDSDGWQAEYRPTLITDNNAIVVGQTSYFGGRDYANLFVVSFDDDGRCTSFVEWYMAKPETEVGGQLDP